MKGKHGESVAKAHRVSNWRLSDWFLTCATCFSFCLMSSLAFVFKHVWTALFFFFFKNVQATNQWGGKQMKEKWCFSWRGNGLWSRYWKVKHIAAVTSSDASFLLRTTDLITSGFALFDRFLKGVRTSESDAKMWLKPLQTAVYSVTHHCPPRSRWRDRHSQG